MLSSRLLNIKPPALLEPFLQAAALLAGLTFISTVKAVRLY